MSNIHGVKRWSPDQRSVPFRDLEFRQAGRCDAESGDIVPLWDE